MKNKVLSWVVRTGVIVGLAAVVSAQAQAPSPKEFSGILNDYTAATGVGGPWEMHGKWTLKLNRDSSKADFSAVMTMEHPDSWVAANPGGVPPNPPNIDNPTARSPHTHHITMTDGMVNTNTNACPMDLRLKGHPLCRSA
jgi:hypothetical protein